MWIALPAAKGSLDTRSEDSGRTGLPHRMGQFIMEKFINAA